MPRTAYVSSHLNVLPHLRRPSSAEEGGHSNVPTLQRLCERTVARHMVEPRSALALLEFADAAGAQLLRQHSLAVSCLLLCRHFSTPALVCSSTGQGRVPKGVGALHWALSTDLLNQADLWKVSADPS